MDALLASFGINTHFQQGYQYSDYNKTIAVLQDLGITQLRDTFPGLGQSGMEAAAKAGLKFDFNINAGWGMGVVPALEAWVRRYPGSIIGIEGPNEVNNWPVTYGGQTGIPAAQAFQSDLYAKVHASPVLNQIPVVALTSWPVFQNKSDIGDIHAYSRSGNYVTPDVQAGMTDEATHNPPAKAIWMTETGYHTHLGQDYDEGVSEPVQAKMIASLYLSAFELGLPKTFLYQLENQYTDPNDEQSYFGLVDQQWRQKPSYQAVKSMIGILKQNIDSVPLGSRLSYHLDGLPTTAHVKQLTTHRGGTILAVWNEPVIWNAQANVEINNPTSDVTVRLSPSASKISAFDPMSGTAAIYQGLTSSSYTFRLDDHPIFIDLHATAVETSCRAAELEPD